MATENKCQVSENRTFQHDYYQTNNLAKESAGGQRMQDVDDTREWLDHLF